MKKGAQVYVEGRLRTRTWQDKNSGENRYALEIVGTHLLMLAARKGEPEASADRIGGGDSDEDLPFRLPAMSMCDLGTLIALLMADVPASTLLH